MHIERVRQGGQFQTVWVVPQAPSQSQNPCADAFTRGAELVDLSFGNFDYLKAMANSTRPLGWWVI